MNGPAAGTHTENSFKDLRSVSLVEQALSAHPMLLATTPAFPQSASPPQTIPHLFRLKGFPEVDPEGT